MQGQLASLGVLVALIALSVGLLVGRLWKGSRTAPEGVAAPSGAVSLASGEAIERFGRLEAEVKNLRREWEDFSRSWEKRWGTVTRGMRRDAASEAQPEGGDPSVTDPLQLDFTRSAPPPVAASHGLKPRPRLVPKVG